MTVAPATDMQQTTLQLQGCFTGGRHTPTMDHCKNITSLSANYCHQKRLCPSLKTGPKGFGFMTLRSRRRKVDTWDSPVVWVVKRISSSCLPHVKTLYVLLACVCVRLPLHWWKPELWEEDGPRWEQWTKKKSKGKKIDNRMSPEPHVLRTHRITWVLLALNTSLHHQYTNTDLSDIYRFPLITETIWGFVLFVFVSFKMNLNEQLISDLCVYCHFKNDCRWRRMGTACLGHKSELWLLRFLDLIISSIDFNFKSLRQLWTKFSVFKTSNPASSTC